MQLLIASSIKMLGFVIDISMKQSKIPLQKPIFDLSLKTDGLFGIYDLHATKSIQRIFKQHSLNISFSKREYPPKSIVHNISFYGFQEPSLGANRTIKSISFLRKLMHNNIDCPHQSPDINLFLKLIFPRLTFIISLQFFGV